MTKVVCGPASFVTQKGPDWKTVLLKASLLSFTETFRASGLSSMLRLETLHISPSKRDENTCLWHRFYQQCTDGESVDGFPFRRLFGTQTEGRFSPICAGYAQFQSTVETVLRGVDFRNDGLQIMNFLPGYVIFMTMKDNNKFRLHFESVHWYTYRIPKFQNTHLLKDIIFQRSSTGHQLQYQSDISHLLLDHLKKAF